MIKKISVAVLVDGKKDKSENEEGVVESKVIPWPPEKIEEFKQIVSKTVGFDEKRGDTIEIKNMEFQKTDFEEADRRIAAAERREYVKNLTIYTVIGVLIILFFLFVVRPFIKWVTENTIESVDTFLPQTIEELEKMQKGTNIAALEEIVPVMPERVDPEKVEGEMVKEKIITLVDSNPHKAALVLRDWLRGEKKPGKTEGVSETSAG